MEEIYNKELYKALDKLEKLQLEYIEVKKYTEELKEKYKANKNDESILDELEGQLEKHQLYLYKFKMLQKEIDEIREKIERQ